MHTVWTGYAFGSHFAGPESPKYATPFVEGRPPQATEYEPFRSHLDAADHWHASNGGVRQYLALGSQKSGASNAGYSVQK